MSFRILQFGDFHLEKGNLDLSIQPLRRIVSIAEETKPDLAVFTGDAVTRRGAFHPEAALEFRVAMEAIASASKFGAIAIDGNHDVSFDGTASFVAGALADSLDRTGTKSRSIKLATGRPRIYDVGFGSSGPVVIAIPTFDRYTMKKAVEDGEGTAEGIAAAIVRGLIAEAKQNHPKARIVAVYHGSLAGAKLGNEQIIRANIDIPLDPAAFAGVDVLLLGHMHRPQELTIAEGVPAIYNGATCPLGWGEKAIEPGVVLVTLYRDEIDGERLARTVSFDRIPLPVVSQMIERDIEIDAEDDTAGVADRIADLADLASVPIGSRVRITVEAPPEVLSLVDAGVEGRIIETFGFRDLSFVKDRTPVRLTDRTMDRRISIVDAVGQWIDEQPGELQAGDRAALISLAAEIEEEVRDEDLDARFDFRPVSLEVSNFCQYGKAFLSFDELAGVTMIRGANTSGKSNLARAIPFALYKAQLSGDVLADLIRNGEKKAEVVLVFESGGSTYRIRRILKRGKDRAATQVLFFEILLNPAPDGAPPAWGPCVEGSESETQAKISALVGPESLFFAATFADQDAISNLLNLRPAELKDLLASVLHRDFVGRVEKVRARRRASEDARQKAATILGEYDRELSQHEESPPQEQLAAITGRRAALQTEKASIGIDDEIVARIEGLVGDQARIRETMKAGEAKTKEAAEVGTRVAELRTKITTAEGFEAQLATLQGATDAAGALQAEEISLQAEAKELRDKIAEEMGRAAGIDTEVQETKIEILRLQNEPLREIEKIKGRIRTEEILLEDAKRAEHLVNHVPCEGGVWTKGSQDGLEPDVDMGACPLIVEAVERKANISDHEENLKDFQRRLAANEKAAENPDPELAKMVEELVGAWKEVQSETDIRKGELQKKTTAIEDIAGKLKAHSDAGVRLARAESGAEGLADLRTEYEATLGRAETLARELAGPNPGDEVVGIERELETLRKDLARRKEERERIEKALVDLVGTAARLEGMIDHLAELAKKRDSMSGTIAEREGEIRIFNLYESALGRDGVPFLLLELYAIPELQERANHYLAPTPWRIQIESERSSVSSGLKPGVYASFVDARGLHPTSSSSGAQSVAIGSSWRQAIADLHANATGTIIRLSVQDEGFGAFDQENLKSAMETVRRIAESRETFLFVSHIPEMEAIADNLIEVTATAEGSMISVEGART